MKVKITAFLHWHKYSWEEKPEFVLCHGHYTTVGPDWVFIRDQVVEVDIPDDFDPRPSQISQLRDEKEKILAEAHVKAANIDDQIQKLLAIEDKSK